MSVRRGDESGTATPLIIGFALLLAMTLAVVVDASAAFLHRQGLDTLADGAALFGAEAGAEGTEVYDGGIDPTALALTRAQAQVGVRDYLASVGAYREFPGLRFAVAVRDDQVVVTLSAPLDLPLTVPGGPGAATLSATGAAIVDPR